MVSEHPSGEGLMYLVFKDNADDYLDGYEMRLHATAVVLALSGIGAMLLASLVLTRRLSRPLHAVADKIRDLSPGGGDHSGRRPLHQVDAPYTELQIIEKASGDMAVLIETFLLLGRSELIDEQMTDVSLASLVETLTDAARQARQHRTEVENHALNIDIDRDVTIHAPDTFLHVLMHKGS